MGIPWHDERVWALWRAVAELEAMQKCFEDGDIRSIPNRIEVCIINMKRRIESIKRKADKGETIDGI